MGNARRCGYVGVEDGGAVAVRADRLFRLKHFAVRLLDRL